MNTQRTKSKLQKRKGITLIEVVVMIIIIGLLIALTLPAMNSSKNSSKKVTCLNNIRNIGLAVINYSSGANGHLPLLVDPNRIQSLNRNAHNNDMSWCITILPFMDSVGFRQKWDSEASLASGATSATQIAAKGRLDLLNRNRFPIFSCPDDQFSNDAGALSYCVNIGYVSANYNTVLNTSHAVDSADGGFDSDTTVETDIPVKFASGVFWRGGTGVPRMSLDFISAADGMTNTVMLSENLQAGEWYSRFTGDLGFGVDMEGILTGPSLKLPSGFNLRTAKTNSRISTNLTAGKGQAWRPSSNHPGGVVNVVFCDGSGSSMTPKMDAGVYARLLTPAGLRYDQAVDDENSY